MVTAMQATEKTNPSETLDKVYDAELGGVESSDKFVYQPLLIRPQEPYLTLPELASLHRESNLDLNNLDSSYGLTADEAAKPTVATP